LGQYLFVVDFIGHIEEDTVQNILKEIDENTYFLKVLGSYPEF
jgi:prephenate dehydratase